MKKIILLALLFVSSVFYSQSQKFLDSWNLVKAQTNRVDSLCNVVKKQKMHLRSRKSKIKLRNSSNKLVRHKLVSKYKSGHIIVMHTYKPGKSRKIKLLEADGKIIAVTLHWENRTQDSKISAQFTKLNDTTWVFTYWTKTLNSDGYEHSTASGVETVKNWLMQR
jgi:hypothetical protein